MSVIPETKVVNIRFEPYDVYVGRAGMGLSGEFGNSHPVDKYCWLCKKVHNRKESIEAFRKDFQKQIQDPVFRARVLTLKGKKLGCFCHPAPCHAGVYKEWLDNLVE
jgi:hypothetical protein